MFASDWENQPWSCWYRFDDESAKAAVPNRPGIYEVRTDFEFGRLGGSSSLVTIGSAVPNLRTRLCRQRFHNTAQFLNRAEKWLIRNGHILEFHYLPTATGRRLEAQRLIEYEHEHGEPPPGNGVLPLSIKTKEIEQKHGGGPAKEILRNLLLRENRSVDEVSRLLGTTEKVVQSLVVFWEIR